MDGHTETLLPEICQKERHVSIILQLLNNYDKTVALLILNMIKPYLSFYIFQVAILELPNCLSHEWLTFLKRCY